MLPMAAVAPMASAFFVHSFSGPLYFQVSSVISLAVAPSGRVKAGATMSLMTVSSLSVVPEPPVSIWSLICWKMLFRESASAAER